MPERLFERSPIELDGDDDLGALIALSGLPSLTPKRLWSLVELGRPASTWRRVCGGAAPRTGRSRDAAVRWAGWSSLIDPEVELDRHRLADVDVLPFGHPGYPAALLEDPEPPALIFKRGPEALDERARVAIVGTRKCSRYGSDVARRLGIALAQRGVDVVSGLASGIDAAAHAGANAGDARRMVAVVAGGVDVVYPKSNRGLFSQIARTGALVSEWPLGATPEPWRFPARNRIVAGLAAAVVVVESAPHGGSMYTVDEALRRNRAVFAVPGNIHSPVSKGTNKLIADGALALHDIDELIDAVAPSGMQTEGSGSGTSGVGIESWLLDAIEWNPVELDALVVETGRSVADITLEVERLVSRGAVRRVGGIVERVA